MENSTLKTQNFELKQSQSDLELVRKFLPDELQSLVVRARELASGGDSGGTKHTAEPTPAADLTTYKRPKIKIKAREGFYDASSRSCQFPNFSFRSNSSFFFCNLAIIKSKFSTLSSVSLTSKSLFFDVSSNS